ncbi:hypothetical protein ACHAXT_008842 [Thalassiosira profunda]
MLQIRASADGNDGQDGGMYLDEETYLHAENGLLRPDGSLSLDAPTQTGPSRGDLQYGGAPPVQKITNKTYKSAAEGLFSPPPSYSYADDQMEGAGAEMSKSEQELSDEERLYQVAQDIESGKNAHQTIDTETLHQQVFAEEQTYLQQSDRFRKSLSSLDDDEESPIAQERREAIEQYNEKVLDDLMKEMDKMEDLAMSREEAMELAQKEKQLSLSDQTRDAVCTRCGLRVAPDMIERAEAIRISKDGGLQKEIVAGGLLCEACYGQKFRSTNEAKVRVGTGSYGVSSAARMFDHGNTEKRIKGESYRTRRRKDVIDRSRSENRKKRVQGIDTSSLFDVPKGYDPELRSEAVPKEQKSTGRPIPPAKGPANVPAKERRIPPKRSPRGASQMLGGRELAKRMERQEPSVSEEESPTPDEGTETRVPEQSEPVSEGADFGNVEDTTAEQSMQDEIREDEWVKVEDPTSKRTLYWNTETGEMKKNLD